VGRTGKRKDEKTTFANRGSSCSARAESLMNQDNTFSWRKKIKKEKKCTVKKEIGREAREGISPRGRTSFPGQSLGLGLKEEGNEKGKLRNQP